MSIQAGSAIEANDFWKQGLLVKGVSDAERIKTVTFGVERRLPQSKASQTQSLP